jgi:hypothetical protein
LVLSPTCSIKPWFPTEERLAAVLIIPSAWGFQLSAYNTLSVIVVQAVVDDAFAGMSNKHARASSSKVGAEKRQRLVDESGRLRMIGAQRLGFSKDGLDSSLNADQQLGAEYISPSWNEYLFLLCLTYRKAK